MVAIDGGIGKKDSQPNKRKILVSLEQIDELEGDTICVRLHHDNGIVRADAKSLKGFNYRDYSREALPLVKDSTNASSYIGDPSSYDYVPFADFLRMLERENDATMDFTPALLSGLEAKAILDDERKAFDEGAGCCSD